MMTRFCIAVLLSFAPTAALAGATTRVPEPETLALLGIGAVALIIAKLRGRK